MAGLTDWESGVFYAACVLYHLRGEGVLAGEIISEAGLAGRNVSGLPDWERGILMRFHAIEKLGLTGLD